MPLDPTSFVPKGPVKSLDIRQFYDLFTGVMSDQPVTFRNVVSIGGDQSVATVPLKIYGAVGQTTDLLDLYPDRTSAQPGFGFSALGTFSWGPGGTAPQDTFMSRIASQAGHTADTPGLLVTPQFETPQLVTTSVGSGTPSITFPWTGFVSTYTSTGALTPVLAMSSDNYTSIYCGPQGLLFVNQQNTARIGTMDNSGNLSIQANFSTPNGSWTFAHGMNITNDGTNVYVRTMPGGSLEVQDINGNFINVNASRLTFPVSGYFWEGIQSVGVVRTNGGIQVDGSTIYMEPSRAVYMQYRSDLGAIYIPYGNGIFVGTAGSVSDFEGKLRFASAPNSPGARLVFPQEPTPKICYYDVGGGNMFGVGINSAEFYHAIPMNNAWTIRRDSGSGQQMLTLLLTSIGSDTQALQVQTPNGGIYLATAANGQLPNLTFYTPNDPQAGGQAFRVITPSTRSAAAVGGGEVHIGIRIFADGDITSGTNMHAVSFQTTSDPNLKQNATVVTDVDCMARVRGNVPVYTYQIPPPDIGGGGYPAGTPNDIGFMAGDVYAVAPEFAALDADGRPVAVVYGQMASLLWGALRNLDARCVAKGI